MNQTDKFPLLNTIQAPADLRILSESQLLQVVEELRGFIIDVLNQCGGHFAANIGVVELTVALHYVFNTPDDRLVWDVGHQAYAHKVLTGRRDRLHTIRQPGGLAPFVSRDESEYDTFGVGHSSTSIGAALGMALANQLNGNARKSVAIIGDGGMTAGMAFEALNHAGSLKKTNLLVILNDNDMSISRNVGGLNNYVNKMLSSRLYSSLRSNSKKVLSKMPTVWELAKRTETHMKGMIVPGTLFEELGFNYIGPIDGHDLPLLIHTLQNLRDVEGPQFLHIRTVKGKGYPQAEADPIKYHAVKPGFHTEVEKIEPVAPAHPTYAEIFGEWLNFTAAQDDKLVAITPAMCEGSGMVRFAEQFSERYFDVGIAEQHAVTLAAGMACENKKPVVAIYSTFLQRAYDQFIHDVCLQNLDVTFAIDRAGIVGGDGATHQGQFDYSFMRCIPNIVIMAPSNENECWQMLNTAYQFAGPAAVRYPRGSGNHTPVKQNHDTLPIGKAEVIRHGKKIALLAFGTMLQAALQVGNELEATVVNMRFIKPLDELLITRLSQEYELLVTIEENTIVGGAGSAVNEFLAKIKARCAILNLGLPDAFIQHGLPQKTLSELSLDAKGILHSIRNFN